MPADDVIAMIEGRLLALRHVIESGHAFVERANVVIRRSEEEIQRSRAFCRGVRDRAFRRNRKWDAGVSQLGSPRH